MTLLDKPLEYDSIFQQGKAFKSAGRMKLVPGGIGWKESATSNVSTLKMEDIDKITWSKVARNYQLAFFTKKQEWLKFDGFPKDALDDLRQFVLENYKIPIETKEYALKGWNWGKCEIQENHVQFFVNEKPSFELPLAELSNAVVSAKNEVTVELHQNDATTAAKKLDSLVDVRFYVPSSMDVDDENGENFVDAATAFCKMIKSSTDIGGLGAAERIVTFQELPFAVPRGRYEADIYMNVIRLRGKSYDYKIPYSSIMKMFLLPKSDDLHVALVLALDPPLRQGQTRYPFLIVQFVRDTQVESTLALSDEVKAKFGAKLEAAYEGPLYEVFTSVLKTVSDKKIIVPGSFKSAGGVSCVKCSMKASEGSLYLLERSFLFIQKPVILIPHEDLVSVTFSRVDTLTANSRTFDVIFSCRGSVDYNFSNLNKEELPYIEAFLRDKKIQFQNELVTKKKSIATIDQEEESESDVSIKGDSLDDEDSSTDEDYQEGDDETDSEASDTESDSGSAASDDASSLQLSDVE